MKIVGHRGASRAKPENTPAAFEAADRMGAHGVELDVRIAPDGRTGSRLVVFHNSLPPGQAALDALPSLNDVLDACGARMLINVEIKNSSNDGGFDPTMAVVAPTLDAMMARGSAWSNRWLISSFNLETVDHCRLVAPGVATALLTNELDQGEIARAVDGGHQAIHPWERVLTESNVAACHEAGLTVNTWTCNDPDRLRELRDFGVDGACSDVPDVALTAIGSEPSTSADDLHWLR